MASGDTLCVFHAAGATPPTWLWVNFTSGSTEPTAGTVLYGDTSAAYATVELTYLTGGSWAGTDAAGLMLLSNSSGTWTSGEFATGGADTASNHLTLTVTPVACNAPFAVRNGTAYLAFDDTACEVTVFEGYMPRTYGGGGLTLTLGWMGNTQTSGDVMWAVAFKSVTDDADDLDVKSFAAVNTGTVSTALTAGEMDYATNITFTNGADMDSVAAGEYFQMLVARFGPATADNLTGDAQLVFIEIKET